MNLLLLAVSMLASSATEAQRPAPIVDMHMHAWSIAEVGEATEVCAGADGIEMQGIDPAKPFDFKAQATCPTKLKAPANDAALLRETLSMMDRLNIVSGVIAGDGPIVAKWKAAAPKRFIAGANFFTDDGKPAAGYAAALEAAVKRGEAQIFAEITPQYRGLKPTIHRSSRSMRWPSGSISRSASTWATARRAGPIGSLPAIAPRSPTRCCSKTCSSGIQRCAFM